MTNVFSKDSSLNEGATESALSAAAVSLGIELPEDYVSFLRLHDGGEGFVGQNYLVLFRAKELYQFNQEYESARYAPGLVLFGSDGSGEGYAFDTRSRAQPIVMVPFVGMDLRYARPTASSFTDFLQKLRTSP
ncbi:MAG TPA: SMI1/KNR4 family protein [Candidatus Acidoferrales bacterium]|nr:SMI1/KNR4 family protein [Candidatus Acidoferrales bacterium]